uniref:Leucine-rich repeat-containing protein 41 n=1 Tax=Sphenodon punctatus TaxID=8508 RepID=A0A8D0GUW7_SPHPU
MLGSHDSRCSLCRVQSATQHPVENETDQDLKVSLKVPQKPNSNSTVSVNLPRNGSESLALPARSGSRSDPCQDARFETEVERDGAGEGSSHPSRQPSLPAGLLPQKRCRRVMDEVGRKRPRRTSRRTRPDPEDLYDFIFAVAREEEELDSHSERQKAHEAGSTAGASPFPVGTSRSERGESDTIPSLQAPGRFRSVSKLELFFVSMTDASWRMLATLLSSWVALEELTLHFNDLGPCLSHLLSGLQSLSRCRDYRLRSLDMNDVFSTVPCAEVIRLFLSAVPQLSALSVGFELEEIRSEGNASSFEDIPETHLEKLAIIFPNERLQTSQLLPALKASRHLQQLSLKNATVSGPQELGLLLRALREWNPNLKRLDFHDINLANREREVLLLLRDSTLQAITFSFCRLFENCSAEFLAEIINAVKRNPTLRLLGLPGNRLGDHRLVALADIFSKDSVSSIYQLDLSSNCIKPDGLLEFAKKLEAHIAQRGEPISCRHLFFSWNHLDKDAGTTREALRRLKTVCSVTSDSWDATQALADFISVM